MPNPPAAPQLPTSDLDDVLDAVGSAINDAINAYGYAPKGEVFPGSPLGPEVSNRMSQTGGEWFVSLNALPMERNDPRYRPEWRNFILPNVPLVATVNGLAVTFSGALLSGLNIHAVLNRTLAAARYTVGVNDDLAAVAAGVSAAINALGLAGVNATSLGAATTVTGISSLAVNVAGIGIRAREVNRTRRRVQATIWAPNPESRKALRNMIASKVGTTVNPRLKTSAGVSVLIQRINSIPIDNSESSYSLYMEHMQFDCEFAIMEFAYAYQIASTQQSVQIGAITQTTVSAGG